MVQQLARSVSFDKIADKYDAQGGLARGLQVAADLAPHLVPGLVLDVGVGTGTVAAGLREHGCTVVGIDLSSAMLARASERLGGGIARGDAQALPFATESVADVVFVHVLHLVGDMDLTVMEGARVLQPGGRLLAVHGSPVSEVDDDIIQTLAPLEPLRNQGKDTPDAVVRAGSVAGLRLVTQRLAAKYEQDATPKSTIESIANKRWSYLMRLDEETWAEQVEPVIHALQELPDPERPRHQVWHVHLTVLAKD